MITNINQIKAKHITNWPLSANCKFNPGELVTFDPDSGLRRMQQSQPKRFNLRKSEPATVVAKTTYVGFCRYFIQYPDDEILSVESHFLKLVDPSQSKTDQSFLEMRNVRRIIKKMMEDNIISWDWFWMTSKVSKSFKSNKKSRTLDFRIRHRPDSSPEILNPVVSQILQELRNAGLREWHQPNPDIAAIKKIWDISEQDVILKQERNELKAKRKIAHTKALKDLQERIHTGNAEILGNLKKYCLYQLDCERYGIKAVTGNPLGFQECKNWSYSQPAIVLDKTGTVYMAQPSHLRPWESPMPGNVLKFKEMSKMPSTLQLDDFMQITNVQEICSFTVKQWKDRVIK